MLSHKNYHGPFRLSQLAEISGCAIVQSTQEIADYTIKNIANIESAQTDELCVLHNKKYLRALEKSQAGACIIHPSLVNYIPPSIRALTHPNPYKAFALISQAFYPKQTLPAYRSPQAYIASTAQIGTDCMIEFGSYIGDHAIIGNRTRIGAQSYIGEGVVVGDDCTIEPQVTITHAELGHQVYIYTGARIGQDGFGFASDCNGHYKLQHRGKVIIGNDVEIGANTCIDRGSLDNTIIEDHCRIDNLVQIGHNVKIGRGSILAGQCGIAGSTKIGNGVMLAGQVGIVGHLKIGDSATVLVGSCVMQSLSGGSTYVGYPAIPAKIWHRKRVFLSKLADKKIKTTK